jgi:hypothetical protein
MVGYSIRAFGYRSEPGRAWQTKRCRIAKSREALKARDRAHCALFPNLQPLTSNLQPLTPAPYHFTWRPNPVMRGCMTLLAKPTDELSTLFETVLMIASELFTLNISNVGSRVNRWTLNDF